MAIFAKNCCHNTEATCSLWTKSARIRRESITGQMSRDWPVVRLLAVLYISSLCGRIPAADACQREHLPDHCLWEYEDYYQPCLLTNTEKVGCIYAKVNSTEGLLSSEDSEKIPSHPRGFAIKSYTSNFQSVHGCVHIFNITWKLPQDASFECLQGFLLDITFDHMGQPQRFLRHFQVETKGLTASDLSQIVFYYDCFVPRPDTLFHIKLRSLPIAPFEISNDVQLKLQTYDNEVNVDLNNTGNWKASIWVKSSETISSSSLGICFTTAPEDFRFARYNVYLLGSSSINPLRLIRYSATVEVNQMENGRDACVTFEVCSDTYRIEIEPESGDGPGCRCKLESKCVEGCETSVFERVDMTQSMSRCPRTVPPPSPTMTRIVTETETPSQLELGKILGVIVGTVLGLVVFGLLGYFVWKGHRKPPTPGQKRVFILDSSETSDFQAYVKFLADFLRRRSNCQVHVLSDWLLTDADSNLDQIWNRIVKADCTIFVMSDACRRHYRDVTMGVIRPPTRRNSVIHNAVVAMIMQLLCSNDYKALRRKCFEVCLPDNRECEELKKAVQRSYRFPGGFSDLVWEVRGVKQPSFYHRNIGKLLERRKVKRDWNMTAAVVMCDQTAVLQECLLEKPVQDDDEVCPSLNNNRDSFDDLNHFLVPKCHTPPLKSEVSKCDSGFSGSAVLDIMEMISFQPPQSRTQSSSTLNSSVGHGGDSLLFSSSSYDFSTTCLHDDEDDSIV